MSNIGEFEFDFGQPEKKQNIQEILQKVENFSVDWDNFDAPNNNQSEGSKSALSDIFNKSKKSESEQPGRVDIDDSRDIMQISIIMPQQGSFRYEMQDHRGGYPKENERFKRLQNLLQSAKKNSLDQFYKNLQRENKAYTEEPEKFNNYKEFKEYIKQLKMEKREKEQFSTQKQVPNPFDSNKLFSKQNKGIQQIQIQQPKISKDLEPQLEPVFKEQRRQNHEFFEKKERSNLLPQEFEQENYFQLNKAAENNKQYTNPTKRFNNFYEGQKLPEKAPEHKDQEDGIQFFDMNFKFENQKKEKEERINLQPIREEKHNSFEKTVEEQKLDSLFKNYQAMKQNFEDLMGQLKSMNKGQEKLVTEVKKLKDEKVENEIRLERKQRREKMERANEQKNQKLDSIKQEIAKIKTSEKDLLYSQINKKIEQLELVVRSALQEITEEKEAKFVPKITNYYCEHEKKFQNIDREFEKNFQQFDPDLYKQGSQKLRQDLSQQNRVNQSMDMFNDNSQNLRVYSKHIIPAQKNANIPEKRQLGKSQKSSQIRSKQLEMNPSRLGSISGSKVSQYQNFYSPLDVHLQANQNTSVFCQFSVGQDQFMPKEFAQQYYPKQYQGYTKNLRSSLTQKTSVVFESFDFHVSARFSIVEDPAYPVLASMRIGNKCSIDLYDVHVIIYGPQGPGVSTNPSTVFQEQVKKNTSFSFQVSLDKLCIQDNGFNIQIYYKMDSFSKKKQKLNFKVLLPLLHIIKPQFMYEQKFINDWQILRNQIYLKPRRLDSSMLRSHQDLKLILPFIDISEQDPQSFSYGITFRYPKVENVFYLKIVCYVSGKASVHIRTQKLGDKKLKQEILNVLNYILFSC